MRESEGILSSHLSLGRLWLESPMEIGITHPYSYKANFQEWERLIVPSQKISGISSVLEPIISLFQFPVNPGISVQEKKVAVK